MSLLTVRNEPVHRALWVGAAHMAEAPKLHFG